MKGHEIQWNLGLETSLGRNGWGFEIQGVHYIQLNLYHNPRYGYRYLVLHQGRALNPRLLNPASTVLCQKAVAENASIFIRGHSCLWKDGRKHSHFYRGKVTDGLWSGQGLKDISNHGCVKLKLSRQITSLCEGSSKAANFRGQIDHFTESFSHSAEDAVCGKVVKSSRYRFSPNLV